VQQLSGVRQLRMGMAGLGQGAASTMPAIAVMPEYALVAGADHNPAMRAGFLTAYPEAKTYDTVAAMCAAPDVDAVWVATPNRFHCEHALEAMRHGKHVVVEKPMAVDLDEADRMVEAAERYGVKLACGHTRSLSIWNRAMRRIALSGELGAVTAIHVWAYTDWLIRPRTADELDPNQGGGIVFRQGPHQIDTVRLLGGGLVRSVRAQTGRWLEARPVPGYYTAFLEFEDGTPATIMHNGYGYFVMSELYPWVAAVERFSDADRARMRRDLVAGTRDEDGEKEEWRIGGRRDPTKIKHAGRAGWKPFDLGPVEVSCERGVMRNWENGVVVYSDAGRRELDLRDLQRPEADPSGGLTLSILEELYAAVTGGAPLYHDGAWGRATLEVVLALIESARERREIRLSRQVAMPESYDAHLMRNENPLAT
jgi:phthalate 4,5-cis-dihydrodiol dehydrogenase